MEDDGKKRPGDDEDLTSGEDAETPSADGEDSSQSDQEEFSLEGELIPRDEAKSDTENDSDSNDQEEDEEEAIDESKKEERPEEEESDPEEGEVSKGDLEDEDDSGEESEADDGSDEEDESDAPKNSASEEEDVSPGKPDEDEPADSESSDDEKEEGEKSVVRGEHSDYHYEEDGYEHWHEDHDYHGDGYHDEDYHHEEETALASQVEKSVTELESHEDEDIAALDEAIEEGHMTFLEHLEELRGTLFRCAGTFLAAFILVAVFFVKINEFLQVPLEKAMANHGIEKVVVTTTPFGIFSYLLQMAFLGALAISSPFLLYFATTFVAPGLTPKEKRALLPASLMALFLLCLGCTFSYFVLIPSALNVSIYLNELLGVSLMWSVDRYMNLLLWMVLGVGLIFEFPMVIAVLVFVGIITVEQLRNFRRYAIVIMFVLSAFVTPTQDPITMLLMAGPLVLLYEGAIFVSSIIEKRRKKDYEAEFGTWDEE